MRGLVVVEQLQLAVGSKLPDDRLREILRAYAARISVGELRRRTGLSRNTLYWHYGLIRERLVMTGYYSVYPAIQKADVDAYRHIKADLNRRRGLRDDNFGWHVSELTFWQDEPDPSLVLKHIHQIIRLTGPLGYDPVLSDVEMEILRAYIAFTGPEIVASIRERKTEGSDFEEEQLRDAVDAADDLYKRYLATRKRMLRGRSRLNTIQAR